MDKENKILEVSEKNEASQIRESKQEKRKSKKEEIEKVPIQGIRGRIIILNPEKSEFAKNLKLGKRADFFKKKE